MRLLKLGSVGPDVRHLQTLLKITVDGQYGPETAKAVRKFQLNMSAQVDGICGIETWQMLMTVGNPNTAIDQDSDMTNLLIKTEYNQVIHKYHLSKNEYIPGPVKNEYIFIHHTAGNDNPFSVVDQWGSDTRGQIATEFIIGGLNHTTGAGDNDGTVVQAFPETCQGWHLGPTGSGWMNRHSVAVELCSMGYLSNEYKTYVNTKAIPDQVCTLDIPFKGFLNYHKYSDKQIQELELLIKYIAKRDNIDVRGGLVQWIKKMGPSKAFDFQEDAFFGKIRGLLSHGNVLKEKTDCYPDQRLVDMLLSL